jgi:glycosyltransferase involved in cell wall biosynthesis
MIHEKFPEYFPRSDNTSRIKKNSIKKATHIICISQNTKNDLMEIYEVDDKKISVIHHGVEVIEQREHLNNKNINGKPYLLFIGVRYGYKNFNKMIHAISCSRALIESFDVIAFGGGEFNRVEQEQILALGFKLNQVKHINGDDDVMRNLFQGASAFVYPSLYEGFGLPPLEAMANKCPVVSSNTSSMPEVILDAAEYFNPNSSDEIRMAIERVVFSSERSRELMENGNKRILEFSWNKCAARTLDVYKKLA